VKVLARIHSYLPSHAAGGELYAHTVFRFLVSHGHEVRVGTREREAYIYEGVEVVGSDLNEKAFTWPDVMVTHLDLTAHAMQEARRYDKPLVHLVHNDRQLKYNRVKPSKADLVVFNSRWIQRKQNWPGRQIVIRPPVIASDYQVPRFGEYLTLINCFQGKGAPTFFELARRMPGRKFLAVKGGYGMQVCPSDVRNVTYLENTPDIRPIYAKTRVLLMPSSYESWGRTAIEAASSGIPTIASPTPGLVESLGPAGIFANHDDIEAWITQIRRLDDQETYERASQASLERSAELDPTAELEQLETALQEVCHPELEPALGS
jgi:glycosyltransferase involved in cell wall biosynthesis